ncbi:hypothetical protein Sme01_16280 [Sphaerisporangium melleum]|uniref:Uncharacterized protein n=1 Tax=Sphaerisporangium melleum TaxID=321316 RepID=A0A917RMN1_9ACTN|nr:hypothetical protein [Sphaerisporangium melleum]GGL14967.1 hypothetical protein GCM10007964_66260 [Sphaerisporangium melleum]GII69152.1 hypothetical protein Sme01_16280 [Sphaerisporangium melleum]
MSGENEGRLLKLSHQEVEQIAKALQTHADAMGQNGRTGADGKQSGSLYSFQYNAQLTPDELGKWPAAQTFAQTVGTMGAGTGVNSLQELYASYIQQYNALIAVIRAGRINIATAEDASSVPKPPGAV